MSSAGMDGLKARWQHLGRARYLMLLALLAALSLYMYFGHNGNSETKGVKEHKPVVEVMTLQRGDMSRHILLSGQTVAEADISLAPKYTGRVAEVLVDLGDYVEAGGASGFVQSPVLEDGSTNIGPMSAFAQELGRDRQGPQIAERFHGYDVSDEVKAYIDHAAETTVIMRQTLDHAVALVTSVYPLPPIPALSAIPDFPLTAEELAMPDEARVGLARKLLGGDYAQLKHAVAEDVGSCGALLQRDFSRAADETRQHIASLRMSGRCGSWSVRTTNSSIDAAGWNPSFAPPRRPMRSPACRIATVSSTICWRPAKTAVPWLC